MVAHVDCLGCGCLIRSDEVQCPFCDASQRHTGAPSSRLAIGLTVGLGLALFGCGDKEGESATAADSNDWDADAVTYAGPDTGAPPMTDGGVTTVEGTSTSGPATTVVESVGDTWDADAVTYAGPDESTTIGDAPETESGTTATDTQDTDAMTGSGTDSIGTSG